MTKGGRWGACKIWRRLMGLAITETNDNVSSLYPECHAQCQYYIVIELCGVLLCKGMVQNDALQHKVDYPDLPLVSTFLLHTVAYCNI